MSGRGAAGALAAVAVALAAAGCGREAPLNDETLARDRYLHELAEREGLGDAWYLMTRADLVFEDGWSATTMVDPALTLAWYQATRSCTSVRKVAVRWMGPSAHLRVRGRGGAMHLQVWGRADLAAMDTRPRVTVTFDGLEFYSRVVADDGGFRVEAVIPADWLHGWSDIYVNLSSVHEPWRDPGRLRVARVEGVAWEPVR